MGLAESAWAEEASLPRARERVERLDRERAQTARERARLEAELDRLAEWIARRKASGTSGLFGDPELDRLLKRSRALSSQIDRMRREEHRLESALLAAARTLEAAYAAALTEAKETFDRSSDPDERARIARRIAALEAQRRQVVAGLARLKPRRDSQIAAADHAPTATDDPEALRAQADRLRDTRDKIARRLEAVRRRIAEARMQRELEEEMDGFLSEMRLVDEGDRAAARLGGEAVAAAGQETAGAAENAGLPARDSDGVAAPVAGASEPGSPAFDGNPPATTDNTRTAPGTGESETFFHLDRLASRPEAEPGVAALPPLGEEESLESLEAQETQLEALIRRLEQRARTLEAQAEAIE